MRNIIILGQGDEENRLKEQLLEAWRVITENKATKATIEIGYNQHGKVHTTLDYSPGPKTEPGPAS
jgi:hypothetical protein